MGMQVYLCVLSKACPRLSNGVTQYYKFTLTVNRQVSPENRGMEPVAISQRKANRARHVLTQQSLNFFASSLFNGMLVT